MRVDYIRVGDTYIMKNIGIGKAEVYLIVGEDWDAQTKRFLSDPRHRRFEDFFVFSRYMYEITLHPVAGGTAETEDLQEDEFPALP